MLTDIECKNAAPRDKAYKLADHAGLYLYVTKAGARSWRYNYRINGQFKTFTYGLYPELSLQDARVEHGEAHKLVSKGIDPNESQKQEQLKYHKNKACTFKVMADEWLLKRKNEVKPKTLRDIESRLKKDVMPFLGHIADI